MKVIRRIYDWMGSKVQSRYATSWLAAMFFIESSFFVVPVDPMLILFCVENPASSFYYAAVATVSSVVGGMFGYFIGLAMWDTIGVKLVTWLISEATFNEIVAKYALYQNWAVLIAGFTPMPYKAVTISAGFCKLPFLPFVIYSTIARGARFFMVAGAISLWGIAIKKFIDKHFNYLVIAFVLIVVMSFGILKGADIKEQVCLNYLCQK